VDMVECYKVDFPRLEYKRGKVAEHRTVAASLNGLGLDDLVVIEKFIVRCTMQNRYNA
jgi:hypothetical protein